MEEKEFSIFDHEFYKWDVSRDSQYLVKSIIGNIKENFYFEWFKILDEEISEKFIKERLNDHKHIRRQLYESRLRHIIEVAREDTDYYKNAQFLLKYLKKILSTLEDYNKYLLEWQKDKNLDKPLKSVFETEEDEKKFYGLADDYMYAWFETTLEECKKVPSDFILKIWEQIRLREEKKEKERLELERQKKEAAEEREKRANVWAKEFAEYVDEDTRPIEDICVWCDEDKTKEKEMRKQWKRYTLIQCEEHEKTKTSIEDQTRYVDLLLEKF